jgi:hypothetical protein
VRADGFTFIETLFAMALTLVVTGALLIVVRSAPDLFAAEGERSDMHQRMRVAAQSLMEDLAAAEAVRPYRSHGPAADPPGTFTPSTITVIGPAGTLTYWLKSEERTETYQLMSYAGGISPDVPVVDHVVGLAFEYLGDPSPPEIVKPLADPVGPWTTYGPKPSLIPVPPYAAGENCVFVSDASGAPLPRLPALAPAGVPLVGLAPAQLTDGPWCPDPPAPDRWDADLLRIRAIAITLRVQSAVAALRGPAGALFAHAGTSHAAQRLAPDLEIRLQVAPRTLNRGR